MLAGVCLDWQGRLWLSTKRAGSVLEATVTCLLTSVEPVETVRCSAPSMGCSLRSPNASHHMLYDGQGLKLSPSTLNPQP